ncbi:MAG: transposase [Patescibacteria group bacterium]
MGRNIQFAQGEIYHIYNRGTEKRNVFLSRNDYRRFLCLLYICNASLPVDLKSQGSTLYDLRQINRGKKLIDIVSYCLMPNHFHLLMTETAEGGISKFMQKLVTAYTMYFNKRHERTGALFQGKFKAKRASANDNYLKYLVAYVHLNPVKLVEPNWKKEGIKNKKQIKTFLKEYNYSSYVDFLQHKNDRIEKIILDTKTLPEYFGKDWKDFETKITEWLEYNEEI